MDIRLSKGVVERSKGENRVVRNDDEERDNTFSTSLRKVIPVFSKNLTNKIFNSVRSI